MIIVIPFERKVPPRYNVFDKIKVLLVKLWTKSVYFHSEFIIGENWITANTDGIKSIKLHELTDSYDYIFININIQDYQSPNVLHRFSCLLVKLIQPFCHKLYTFAAALTYFLPTIK